MRQSLVIFCLILLSACTDGGGGGDKGPSLENNACSAIGLSTRIIDGTACGNVSDSPVVKIALIDSQGLASGLCSGTMITSTDVLTAAHCFPLGVAAAGILIEDDFYPARSVTVHGGFFQSDEVLAAFNDVAILHLASPVSLPTLPILVSREPVADDILSIFGYGVDENEQAGELKSGEMAISQVTENHIFTTFSGEGSNTCLGDSGGPATISIEGQAAIAGITSTGTLITCEAGDTSLFTKIQSDSVLNFILEVVPEVGTA